MYTDMRLPYGGSVSPAVSPRHSSHQDFYEKLTVPEILCLIFAKTILDRAINEKVVYVQLGCMNIQQNEFKAWVAKHYTTKLFATDELAVYDLVQSIWGKVKIQVEFELINGKKNADLENEQQEQESTRNLTKYFNKMGNKEIYFTTKQIEYLSSVASYHSLKLL